MLGYKRKHKKLVEIYNELFNKKKQLEERVIEIKNELIKYQVEENNKAKRYCPYPGRTECRDDCMHFVEAQSNTNERRPGGQLFHANRELAEPFWIHAFCKKEGIQPSMEDVHDD